MDHAEASAKLRALAKEIAAQIAAHDPAVDLNHVAASLLQIAWSDAVRDKFTAMIDLAGPETKRQHRVAVQMMRQECYNCDPICLPIGAKPMIAKVDGHDCICFDYSMTVGVPLSAIFMNRAQAALDVVARIAAAPFPLTTAGGETFNSIEDMKKSSSRHMRGLAGSMARSKEVFEQACADAFNAATQEHKDDGSGSDNQSNG